jgi:hypothetical protein
MSQNDGELAWQGKTYNALKDKKHLTGINKEVIHNTTSSSVMSPLHSVLNPIRPQVHK